MAPASPTERGRATALSSRPSHQVMNSMTASKRSQHAQAAGLAAGHLVHSGEAVDLEQARILLRVQMDRAGLASLRGRHGEPSVTSSRTESDGGTLTP